MRRMLLAVALTLPLVGSAGCMSTMAHLGGPSGLEGPFEPYAATKVDVELATLVFRDEDPFNVAIGALSVLGAVDTPLTLALDTVFVPADLIALRRWKSQEKPASCSDGSPNDRTPSRETSEASTFR